MGLVILVGLIPGVRTSRFGKTAASIIADRSAFVWVGLIMGWTIMRNLPGLMWLSPDR